MNDPPTTVGGISTFEAKPLLRLKVERFGINGAVDSPQITQVRADTEEVLTSRYLLPTFLQSLLPSAPPNAIATKQTSGT